MAWKPETLPRHPGMAKSAVGLDLSFDVRAVQSDGEGVRARLGRRGVAGETGFDVLPGDRGVALGQHGLKFEVAGRA